MASQSSFLSLQFSQALAIRSYTKFVMGVSQALCPPHCPVGLVGGCSGETGHRAGRWHSESCASPREVVQGRLLLTPGCPWVSDCSEHADLPLPAGR